MVKLIQESDNQIGGQKLLKNKDGMGDTSHELFLQNGELIMATSIQTQVYEAQIRVLAGFHNLRQSRENGIVSLRDLLEDIKSTAPRVYSLFQRCKPENSVEFGFKEFKQLFDVFIKQGVFVKVEPDCLKESCSGWVERVLMGEAGSIMPMSFGNKEDRHVFLVVILSHLLYPTEPSLAGIFSLEQILADLKGIDSEQFRKGFGFELSTYILERILTEAVQMGFITKDNLGTYKLADTKKVKKFLDREFLKEKKRRTIFQNSPAS